jgi:hypothetical protein
MEFSKQLGTVLAEELVELVIQEESGNLTEIRDLATLKGHIASHTAKYGKTHPKTLALHALVAKKKAAIANKNTKLQTIQAKQEAHAKAYGYRKVKGTPHTWEHEAGHRLTFDADRNWNHLRSGKKRAVGGGSTPIRDLKAHLQGLHESIDPQLDSILEIRGVDRLGMEINKNLLHQHDNPLFRERLRRLQQLHAHKFGLEVR